MVKVTAIDVTRGVKSMASARRIGAPDAKNRGVLLDAAEQLMLEEGYAAVTSRRVAEKAGLKPQLVHYYFRTMDDLFLEVFRRRAEQGLAAQARALESPQPLWALWRFGTDPAATRLTWSSRGWRTTARRCEPRSPTTPNDSAQEQIKAMTATLQRYGVDVWSSARRVDGVRHQRFSGDRDGTGARHAAGHAEMLEFCEAGCAGSRGSHRLGGERNLA